MIEQELLDSLWESINILKEKEKKEISGLSGVLEKLEQVQKQLVEKSKEDGKKGDK